MDVDTQEARRLDSPGMNPRVDVPWDSFVYRLVEAPSSHLRFRCCTSHLN